MSLSLTISEDRLDRWIFGSALALFVVSTVLIVDDRLLFRGDDSGSRDSIAKLYRKDNDVRRRFETDTAFMPVQNAQDMYRGDAVFTGDRSEAEVVFTDGSKVNVEAGSLVVLQLSKENPKISIEKGTISGKLAGGKKMAIVTGGKEAELSGQDAQIQVSVAKAGQAAQITVLSGQAQVTAGDKKIQLDQSQAASFSASGKISDPIKYTLELREPAADRQIWTDGETPVAFKWSTREKNGKAEFEFELSRERDFRSIELRKKTGETELSLKELPGEGAFYWRVSATDRSADQAVRTSSPVSRILVLAEKAPRALLPADGESVRVAPKEDSSKVGAELTLKWAQGSDAEPPAPKYAVEISKERKDSLFTRQEVATQEWKTPLLATGQYYWRVKPLDPSRKQAPWSKYRSFEISEDIPAAPLALKPEAGQKYLKKTAPAQVSFEWKVESVTADRYLLEISSDESFKDKSKILVHRELKDTSFDWSAERLGTYFWRTRAITADGGMTAFTKPGELVVAPWEALEAPRVDSQKLRFTLGGVIGTDQSEGAQKIQWEHLKTVTQYQVEISDSTDFTKPVYQKTTEGSFLEWPDSLRPAKDRQVYYRIRGQVTAEDWTDWSQAAKVDLRVQVAELDKPAGVSPRGGQEMEVDPGKVEPLEFQWSAVDGADGYEIQISNAKSFTSLLEESKSRDPVFHMKHPSMGKTFWRIRARNTFVQSEWAGPYAFTRVPSPESIVLPAPVLIGPLGNVFQRDDDELDLRWEAVEGAKQYEVTVVRNPDTGTRLPAGATEPQQAVRYRVDSTRATIQIPRDGRYTWQVRASAGVKPIGAQQLPVEFVNNGGRMLASIEKSDEKSAGSKAQFNLIRSPLDSKRPGYIALSSMLAPYEYRFSSDIQGGTASANSSALTFSLSSEYWMKPRWGVGAQWDSTSFNIGAQTFVRSSFQVVGKHRLPIDAEHGWHLAPFAGIEGRQYFQITPAAFTQFWTYGMNAGFDLRKTLSESFSMNLKMQYFYPLMLSGLASGSSLSSVASNRNLSAGLQGYYWLRPQIGIGVGAFLDWRSISYKTSGSSGSEKIYSDGSYFYTSLMYRFGQ